MAECPFCRLLGSRRHAARIAEFEHSVAFLHLDQTHPGRSVLILKRHFDHYHELPEPLFTAFNRDLRRLAAALLRSCARNGSTMRCWATWCPMSTGT